MPTADLRMRNSVGSTDHALGPKATFVVVSIPHVGGTLLGRLHKSEYRPLYSFRRR